jgi:hypothetical protein
MYVSISNGIIEKNTFTALTVASISGKIKKSEGTNIFKTNVINEKQLIKYINFVYLTANSLKVIVDVNSKAIIRVRILPKSKLQYELPIIIEIRCKMTRTVAKLNILISICIRLFRNK